MSVPPDSARALSVSDESIPEEVESDHDVLSQSQCSDVSFKSNRSVKSNISIKSLNSDVSRKSHVSQRSEKSDVSRESAKSVISHKSEKSMVSQESVHSSQLTRSSLSRHSQEVSEKSSGTYSDDFSDSSLSFQSEASVKSRHSSRKSHASQQDDKEESVNESLHTEDERSEISEQLSVRSEISEQSENLYFDLKGDARVESVSQAEQSKEFAGTSRETGISRELGSEPADKVSHEAEISDGEVRKSVDEVGVVRATQEDENTSVPLPTSSLPHSIQPDIPEHSEKSEPSKSVTLEDRLSGFNVGDRILVANVKPGTLRYKGTTSFAPGYWGGVELDKAEGGSDGTKDGVVYFHCPPRHGLFVPPEKISHLPEGFVASADQSETSIEEDLLSEASDHTVTEDQEPSIDDITKEALPSTEKSADISLASKKDDESSLLEDEDISEATDSELVRVISSAAAAVEKFTPPASPRDEVAVTPRNVPELPVDETPQPSQDMDQMVDRITDSLTSMVVSDSLKTMGGILKAHTPPSSPSRADKISVSAAETGVANSGGATVDLQKHQDICEPKKPEKPHTPLLDLLTRERDDLQRDLDAAEFKEESAAKEREIQEAREEEEEAKEKEETAKEEVLQKETDVARDAQTKTESATENVMKALLGETIDVMMQIRKNQQRSSSLSSSLKTSSPSQVPSRTTTDEIDGQMSNDAPRAEVTKKDSFWDAAKAETSNTTTAKEELPAIARPVSPIFGESASSSLVGLLLFSLFSCRVVSISHSVSTDIK